VLIYLNLFCFIFILLHSYTPGGGSVVGVFSVRFPFICLNFPFIYMIISMAKQKMTESAFFSAHRRLKLLSQGEKRDESQFKK
jgi:hypothetical protein